MKFLVTTIALALIAPLGCTDDSNDDVPKADSPPKTTPKSPFSGQGKAKRTFEKDRTSFIEEEKVRLAELEAHIAGLLTELEQVDDKEAAEAIANAKEGLLALQGDGLALREQYADAANIKPNQWTDIKESLESQANSLEDSLGQIVRRLQSQEQISDSGFNTLIDETARQLAREGSTRQIHKLDDDRAALVARLEELKKSADRTLADLREIQSLQQQLEGIRAGIGSLLTQRNDVADQADQAASENRKRWQSVLKEVDELDNELESLFDDLASTGDSDYKTAELANDESRVGSDTEQDDEVEEKDDSESAKEPKREATSIEDRLNELKSGADQTAADIRRFDAIQAQLRDVREQVDALRTRRNAVAERAGETTATSRENWQSLQREVQEIDEELESLYQDAPN